MSIDKQLKEEPTGLELGQMLSTEQLLSLEASNAIVASGALAGATVYAGKTNGYLIETTPAGHKVTFVYKR